MTPESYGTWIAEVYDEWFGALLDTDAAVGFLAARASGGAVLELGVGTGRLAIPLAERGLDVCGIDTSKEMLRELRAKPGAERVRTVHGDMVTGLEQLGTFDLVFVAFNGIFGIQSAAGQQALFRAVHHVLADDGLFVLEARAPTSVGLAASGSIRVVRIEEQRVLLETTLVDEVSQTIDLQMIELGPGGTRLFPARLRYAFPNELDLMAQSAGLEVCERRSGWSSTAASPVHQKADVVTYRKATGART